MLIRAFVLSLLVHMLLMLGAPALDALSPGIPMSREAPVTALLVAQPARLETTERAKASETNDATRQSAGRVPLANAGMGASTRSPLPMAPLGVKRQVSAPSMTRYRLPDASRLAFPESPSVSAQSADAEALREYRMSLAREARHFRRRAKQVQAMGLEGEVLISLRGSPALSTPEIVLGRGSGHDVLDIRAIEMMRAAARGAPLPEALAGLRFRIDIPIQFRLDE